MRLACSRNQVFHWAIARMLVGKSSHMLHVQFAAVMPPARIARKISGPKFETIRPSMMIVLSCRLGMSRFLAAPRPFRMVHRRIAVRAARRTKRNEQDGMRNADGGMRRLPGWAERTRTRKCQFEKPFEIDRYRARNTNFVLV